MRKKDDIQKELKKIEPIFNDLVMKIGILNVDLGIRSTTTTKLELDKVMIKFQKIEAQKSILEKELTNC
jgi:hypothetical protein